MKQRDRKIEKLYTEQRKEHKNRKVREKMGMREMKERGKKGRKGDGVVREGTVKGRLRWGISYMKWIALKKITIPIINSQLKWNIDIFFISPLEPFLPVPIKIGLFDYGSGFCE